MIILALLSKANGRAITVLPKHVAAVMEDPHGCTILLDSGRALEVTASIREINVWLEAGGPNEG